MKTLSRIILLLLFFTFTGCTIVFVVEEGEIKAKPDPEMEIMDGKDLGL